MSYIGNVITGNLSATTDLFSGDGSGTQVALSRTPASSAGIMVFISGVYKTFGADWTLTADKVNFTSPPAVGTNNIVIQHLTNGTVAISVPADGTVNSSKLSSNVSITNFTANTTMKLPVFASNTARDTAITAPQAGMVAFITTGTQFQGHTGSGWIVLSN